MNIFMKESIAPNRKKHVERILKSGTNKNINRVKSLEKIHKAVCSRTKHVNQNHSKENVFDVFKHYQKINKDVLAVKMDLDVNDIYKPISEQSRTFVESKLYIRTSKFKTNNTDIKGVRCVISSDSIIHKSNTPSNATEADVINSKRRLFRLTSEEKLYFDKTTYCRPIINYNQEFINKTMEKNSKLKRLVKKLILAQQEEKDNITWNNYINELKNKHYHFNHSRGTSSSQHYQENLNPEMIDDFYLTKFFSGQSKPCINLLEDLYGTYSIVQQTRKYDKPLYNSQLPRTHTNKYENTPSCYPISSLGKVILNKEKHRLEHANRWNNNELIKNNMKINEKKKESIGKDVCCENQKSHLNQTGKVILAQELLNKNNILDSKSMNVNKELRNIVEITEKKHNNHVLHSVDNKEKSLQNIETTLETLVKLINLLVKNSETKNIELSGSKSAHVSCNIFDKNKKPNTTKNSSNSQTKSEKPFSGITTDSSGSTDNLVGKNPVSNIECLYYADGRSSLNGHVNKNVTLCGFCPSGIKKRKNVGCCRCFISSAKNRNNKFCVCSTSGVAIRDTTDLNKSDRVSNNLLGMKNKYESNSRLVNQDVVRCRCNVPIVRNVNKINSNHICHKPYSSNLKHVNQSIMGCGCFLPDVYNKNEMDCNCGLVNVKNENNMNTQCYVRNVTCSGCCFSGIESANNNYNNKCQIIPIHTKKYIKTNINQSNHRSSRPTANIEYQNINHNNQNGIYQTGANNGDITPVFAPICHCRYSPVDFQIEDLDFTNPTGMNSTYEENKKEINFNNNNNYLNHLPDTKKGDHVNLNHMDISQMDKSHELGQCEIKTISNQTSRCPIHKLGPEIRSYMNSNHNNQKLISPTAGMVRNITCYCPPGTDCSKIMNLNNNNEIINDFRAENRDENYNKIDQSLNKPLGTTRRHNMNFNETDSYHIDHLEYFDQTNVRPIHQYTPDITNNINSVEQCPVYPMTPANTNNIDNAGTNMLYNCTNHMKINQQVSDTEASQPFIIKKYVEDYVKRQIVQPYSIKITFEVATKDCSTEITKSLSTQGTVDKKSTRTSNNSKNGQMAIASNTDPLNLLSLLRISTDAIKQLMSYMPNLSMYLSQWKLHTFTEVTERSYVCNICGGEFRRPSELSDHIQKHYLTYTKDCCICKHVLDTARKSQVLFTCEYCGQKFTRAYCCQIHEQSCAIRLGKKHDVSSSRVILN